MHTRCTLGAHSEHTQCTLGAHSVHTQCTLRAHSVHTRCTLSAHPADAPSPFSIHIVQSIPPHTSGALTGNHRFCLSSALSPQIPAAPSNLVYAELLLLSKHKDAVFDATAAGSSSRAAFQIKSQGSKGSLLQVLPDRVCLSLCVTLSMYLCD